MTFGEIIGAIQRRENKVKIKSGLGFHCHHDVLVEYVCDYDERVEFIKKHKSIEEQGLRLRLFRLIPHNRLPRKGLRAFYKAEKACDEAEKASDEARKAFSEANEAWKAYYEAMKAYNEAVKTCNEAWKAYIKYNKDGLGKLHKELCSDCPWNGETIFTRKNAEGKWS